MSAIKPVYSNSFLNATLARWLDAGLEAPALDCKGCALPAKCCAFQPFIPNFLLGGWLGAEEGLADIKNILFSPIGAVALPEYRLRHQQTPEAERGPNLLCGFFNVDQRSCELWRFRPGECSTYYCDSDRILPARQALSERSFAVEVAVAQMALVEQGFSPREIAQQIDLVNGSGFEVKNYPGPELLMMYKKAWNWCQDLTPQTINGWL